MILGYILLTLGAVGILLPVLPTTPFVLAAALCFSSSNDKASNWLRRNRFFGPYIENYETKQGIRLSVKIWSILFVWAGLTVSMIRTQAIWMTVLLAVVGVAVTVHLLMIKTKEKHDVALSGSDRARAARAKQQRTHRRNP